MTPDLVRTPGLVLAGVEDVSVVPRPGQAFADPADLIVEDVSGGDIAHDEVVTLLAVSVS